MKVKITPIGPSSQIIEFNVTLPTEANSSIAPVSTLSLTQRWAEVINTSTTSTPSYSQITKFNIVLNTQYVDCKGNNKVITNTYSTIISSSATSTTITDLTPQVTKVLDVIIPKGVGIVNQTNLNDLPTTIALKGNCAYSVFDIQLPASSTPTV